MKKLFSILFLICLAFGVDAQSTTPRFGTAKNQDNSYRAQALSAQTITPTSTMVTVAARSTYYNLVSIATVSISPTFTANVTSAKYGDLMDMIVTLNATGTRTITLSTNFIANASTTQTLAASKQAHFRFIFDGAKWMEMSRSIQP